MNGDDTVIKVQEKVLSKSCNTVKLLPRDLRAIVIVITATICDDFTLEAF